MTEQRKGSREQVKVLPRRAQVVNSFFLEVGKVFVKPTTDSWAIIRVSILTTRKRTISPTRPEERSGSWAAPGNRQKPTHPGELSRGAFRA